jgi:hypothetical protein
MDPFTCILERRIILCGPSNESFFGSPFPFPGNQEGDIGTNGMATSSEAGLLGTDSDAFLGLPIENKG